MSAGSGGAGRDQCSLNNSTDQDKDLPLSTVYPHTYTHTYENQEREDCWQELSSNDWGSLYYVLIHSKFGTKLAPGCELRRIPRQQMSACECLAIAMETHLHTPISVGNRHPRRVIRLA